MLVGLSSIRIGHTIARNEQKFGTNRYGLLFSESVATKTKNISGRTLQSIASEMIFAVYKSPDVWEKTHGIYESVFMHCL